MMIIMIIMMMMIPVLIVTLNHVNVLQESQGDSFDALVDELL